MKFKLNNVVFVLFSVRFDIIVPTTDKNELIFRSKHENPGVFKCIPWSLVKESK